MPDMTATFRESRDEAGGPVWFHDAACRDMDTDLFFEERGWEEEKALAVCQECPVRLPCLSFAMDENMQYGVWGGTTRLQRQRMKRESA